MPTANAQTPQRYWAATQTPDQVNGTREQPQEGSSNDVILADAGLTTQSGE